MKAGKRTQWGGIITAAGGVLNIVRKLFITNEPVEQADIAIVIGGILAYTAGEKIDRTKNGG